MKDRAGKITIVRSIALVGLVWMGCAGSFAAKPGKGGSACTQDTDCALGFCDRGVCVELVGERNYGAACDSLPPARTATPGQADPQCGGFLCIEGRCRSCRTNAECQMYFGAGQCGLGYGFGEGTACLPMAEDFWRMSSKPMDPLACANVGPDVPVEQRLAAGKACVRDCDCRSSFCDRGTCADGADIGAWNYGKRWCPTFPPTAPADYEVIGLGNTDECVGYICIDHRCRSCVSDAECQEGRLEYRCLPLYGLPGRRCGWPGEATLGPARNRMGPPGTGEDLIVPPDHPRHNRAH